ncbi:MAG TPA: hypothetical protein VFK66_11245 [Oryzihumus sp.]|nr:hypothetical protein [Oryzihumus sp.]
MTALTVRPALLAVVLVSSAAALACTFGLVGPPWRAPLVFWFVGVVPGLAMQGRLGITDPLARATVAVAVSVALAAITSEALAIASLWSPTALVLLLAVMSALGCLRRTVPR